VQPTLTAEVIRDVNTRYHDAAAEHYDAKWGIDFGEVGRAQVVAKMGKALGHAPRHYPRSLEIGAGTGYFSLNLLGAGIVGEATCSDISPGMLTALADNARGLGLRVHSALVDAERLPFADASFDLVLGHAVLHHIPDLASAFAEFERVLSPGGTVVFAGEPSRYGDRLAQVPKRAAAALAPLWRRAIRARGIERREHDATHALEGVVDVHSFAPAELARAAEQAGLHEVRVTGEELLANGFGWISRTLEASAQPEDVPWAWRQYAHRGYLLLQELDRRLLEPHLPAAIFYNLMISARKHPARKDPARAPRRGARSRGRST
jgi:ubiquinone/menaquinone biosynthesis C-methylase UbiE